MRFSAEELARLEGLFAAGEVPEPAPALPNMSADAPPASIAELVAHRRRLLGRRR